MGILKHCGRAPPLLLNVFLSNVYFSLSLPDRILIFFFNLIKELSKKHCILLGALITLILCKIMHLTVYSPTWTYEYVPCKHVPTWPKICAKLSYFLYSLLSQLLIWGERSLSEYKIVFLRRKIVALKILHDFNDLASFFQCQRESWVRWNCFRGWLRIRLTCFVYFNKICLQYISNSLNLLKNLSVML